MKLSLRLLAILSTVAYCNPSAHAQIVIDPTFDSSITSNPQAAEIESGIDQAISRIESDIETPITVNIDFTTMSSGLGESDTYVGTTTYSSYRSQLAASATSPDDTVALASLPVQTNNPVNGNADIELTLPLARALGYSGADPPTGDPDGTISLNLSLMNLSRTGSQNPSDYDLQAVVAHEMDEVLGIGGAGSLLNYAVQDNHGVTTGIPVGVLDLFRYSSSGHRSFTTSSSATSYFSINGGVTNLVGFNQQGSGSADYADWATGATPQVQDAYGSPGVDINVGANELTALDVVGYTLTPAGLRIEEGYNLASANTIATPVTLTNVHVGGTFGTSALSLTNTAPSGSYTEGLDASFSGTTGSAGDNGGTITRLTGGSSNSSSLVVGLGGSNNTGTAGAVSGTVTVALTSDGTGTSGLGLTSLTSQTITVTGGVYNLASANTITTPVSLGTVHEGGTFGTSALSLTNTSPGGSYTEGLDASFSGTTGATSDNGSSISLLTGGSSNSSSLAVGLGGSSHTGTAGAVSGTVTVALTSDGTGTSGLGLTSLTSQTISVSGFVYSGQGVWNTNGNGNWSDVSKWQANGGVPGLDPGFTDTDTATFGSAATSANPVVSLNGANPSLAGITFNNSTQSYTLQQGSGGSITLNNGGGTATVLDEAGNDYITAPVLLASNANFTADSGASLTDSNTISAIGGKTLTTSGAVYLTGNNTLTGQVTVTNGTLGISTLAAPGSAQPLGENSTVALAGGTSSDGILQYTGGTTTMGQNVTVTPGEYGKIDNSGGGTLTLGGTLTKTGIASGAATVLTLSGGTFIVTGQITGTDASFNSDFDVNGATVTLDNSNNNYSGPTSVYGGGTLINGLNNALPTGTVLTLGNAADGAVTNTYDLGGYNQSVGALNSTSAGGNANIVTNSGASGSNTLTLTGVSSADAAVSSAFGGVIQDGANAHTALAVSGGTHVLTGNNTYTGGTTINNGTLQVGDDGTTGILGVGGVSGTDGTLAYDRSNALTETNTISGGVAVSQIGSGATTFTANNTYTGGTTISNGRLYANNATGSTGSGTVTVDSSGTIAGLGTVALSGTHGISLTGSGAIVPGGVQSGSVANGNLTIDTTSITAHRTILSLNGASGNPANNASLTFTLGSGVHLNANQEIDTGSQLVVTGPDGMAVANTIAFNVGGGAGNLVNINDLVGDGLVRNGEYVLIDGSNTTYTGLTTELYPTYVKGVDYGYQITGGLVIGSGAYDSSLLYLKDDNIDIEVAPEPSTWALLLGSLALLALVHFRRQCKQS